MSRHTCEQGGRGREARPRETARRQAAHSGHRTAAAVPWRGSRRRRHRHRELHRCFQGLGPPAAVPSSAPRSLAFCSASGREGEGPRGLLPHCSAEQSIQVGVALWMGHLTALTLSRLVSRPNPSASSGPTDKAAAVCPVCSLSGYTAVITQCHRELFRTQPTSSSHFQPLLRT